MKVPRAELGDNVRLNKPSELERNNNYCDQAETLLMEEDWELVIDKKKRNLDVLNRNLIQIIPTKVNKPDSKHNLKDYEKRTNMRTKELGAKNGMNHTLTKEKLKYEESQRTHKLKIRTIGDSHVKKSAAELRMILDHRYIMGITKPGALMNISTMATDEVASLSNKDILILWVGANDISKNNTNEALKYLTKFMEEHKRTNNIILIHSLHRYDLTTISCVNKEVVKFNRQVKKISKLNPNVKLMETDLQRKHFTRHGQHLNQWGKELVASELAKIINS
ncbi:hypothetical protein B7P43_G17824 [Cryptotermes secundus]|uniref:SGNH hydrolase-type esterase domain-containing protein n=2 Tax=Cryptotermes secundus TaxID=105785 RepID=A0A2J7QR26_9NEOP|nr:hypothetical protein B7P43_G17824 [Cryptotermes secundus]